VTQKQPQPQESAQFKCADCGGASFFETPISDPKTMLTYNLHRCRDCGQIRWPDQRE
jgi:hypothetical protein